MTNDKPYRDFRLFNKRKARKYYICSLCKKTIEPKETYYRSYGKDENGYFYDNTYCEVCGGVYEVNHVDI